MLKNYLKIAWRNLMRNKSYAFINIAGLVMGTLSCLYIVIYVQDQFSYDKHHQRADDIYRVNTLLNSRGQEMNMSTASPPVGPALKADFPAVEEYTRVVNMEKMGIPQNLVTYGEKALYEKSALLVDSTFFSIFDYHFVAGGSQNALNEPNTIVLEKSFADKLFGDESAMGKIIQIDNVNGPQNLKVTGVVDGKLGKSHLQGQLFIAMNSSGMGQYTLQNNVWAGNNFTSTFVKLHRQSDPRALESKLPAFLQKYGADELRNMGMQKKLSLQAITAMHTDTSLDPEMFKTQNPTFLYVLLLVAILIQAIACINFMNLSTAQASLRGKEIGVRKVIGAEKQQLFRQFMGESFLMAFLGVVIALPFLWLLLPLINQLTESNLLWHDFLNIRSLSIIAIIVLATGLLAGSYPAFYLASFSPLKVLKGNFSSRISGTQIRRVLVVFQFVLTIGLIASILVIRSQLGFIKETDLGFESDQRLIFSFHTTEAQQKMGAFAQAVLELLEVAVASKTNNYPSQFVHNDRGVYLPGGDMANSTNSQFMTTDEYFVKANGIHLLEGRDFRQGDVDKVLINESLAKKLQLDSQTAIGAKLYSQYGSDPATFVEVIGVMKDFHYNSLHHEVRPFMLQYTDIPEYFSHIVLAVNNDDYTSVLRKLEQVWHQVLPNIPFDYAFMDQQVQQQYEKEVVLSRVINAFTVITITISCLGLFGLSAFSTEQRRKEIGIRKVLGATVSGIVGLLSKDFVKLVLIAIAIASPIAWWAMNKWLQDFSYKIEIQWWMFALAGLAAVVIALLTVATQAIKAAVANPVKSLRDE
ncbi:ABC transporter permease [Olivibacter sitiensis]|uniref:ABC transporter permease n=1 Tax=Olivibacter sitiensis TaxID=376470 RepID=UPI0004053C72|nr:ABC transporter permease [Olivibacter sitiensis]